MNSTELACSHDPQGNEESGLAGAGYGPAAGRDDVPVGALTKREQQVLELIVDGKSCREIAAQLGICFKTVVSHRTRIMEKLEVHETASLVRRAIKKGLVEP
jgi:DNA-binding NarL/FixJ family response regulator